MDKGIAFAGNLIVDQIKFIENYPAAHTLTTVTETASAIGGLVCNCIVGMAKLTPDIPLKAVGVVGDDDMGRYILDAFAEYPAIDASGVHLAGGAGTSFTDVMTTPDGGRTFFQYRGANALLGPEHFDFDTLQADILHIGYILLLDRLDGPDPDYPSALCRVLAEARARGIRTSIDVVSEDSDRYARLVPPALQYADYCIINEIEAGRTTGIPLRRGDALEEDSLRPCLQALAKMGVGRWAVIHTPELSCGLDVQSGEVYQKPSWRIPEGFKRSSVGAGDAFATGVLYGAYMGWGLAQAIDVAGAVAAYSLSGSGATDAIKPLKEILREMESFR